MGKIDRLTKDIEKLRQEIMKHEDKLQDARELHKAGRIDKDQWAKARHKYQEKIRIAQITIRRKEKARLTFEKHEKEKKEAEKDSKK